jgi:hypothetical protein
MVYWPRAFVARERLTPVSTEVAVTWAPSMGAPRSLVTRPVTMSVVLPTCAPAVAGARAGETATTAAPAKALPRAASVRCELDMTGGGAGRADLLTYARPPGSAAVLPAGGPACTFRPCLPRPTIRL